MKWEQLHSSQSQEQGSNGDFGGEFILGWKNLISILKTGR